MSMIKGAFFQCCKKNAKRLTLTGAGLFFAILLAIFLLFHLSVPVIKSGSMLNEKKEIASNATIRIIFNQWMSPSSLKQGFQIEPEVPGHFRATLSSLTFFPGERLKTGETYTITLPKTIRNILGRPIKEEQSFFFSVIDPPKVLLALPKEDTSVDSKVTVMFDRPMTELTTYDTAEARGFPLIIDPPVEGRFKWLGSSALQFIPKTRLHYSTLYSAVIPAGTKSLDNGLLEQKYTFTFQTERVQRISSLLSEIKANDPFTIQFNQEMNLDSVKSHITAERLDGLGGRVSIPLKAEYQQNEKKEVDKKIIHLFPQKNDWGYDNTYSLLITKGIQGMEGNLFTDEEVEHPFGTHAFLDSYSPQGEEIGPFSPVTLRFNQEVDLASARTHLKTIPAMDFRVNYGQKCDPDWEPESSPDEECDRIDDLSVLVFTPKEQINNLETIQVTVGKETRAKNGLTYLKNDIEWSFRIAPKFEVFRISAPDNKEVLNYKQFCLFSNNPMSTEDVKDYFSFSPVLNERISVHNQDLRERSEWDKTCEPENQEEHYGIHVYAYLNPNTAYAITVKKTAKDTFGQALGKDITFDYHTERLNKSDTDLRLMQNSYYAISTPDQHAATVFKTYNLDHVDLKICHLSAQQWIDVDTEYNRISDKTKQNRYGWMAFQPSPETCEEYKTVTKPLKKVFWKSQYLEVEIEEALGHKPELGAYYIGASSPYSDYLSFQVVTLTDLHVAMKQSKDAGLFWVTSLSAGQPLKGATIHLYNKKAEKVPGLGKTDEEGLYKTNLESTDFSYVVVTKGQDEIVMNRNWSDGISSWNYNLNYSPVQQYTKGYVYTDRPLYRPTHQVFFKGMIRTDYDAKLALPKDMVVNVSISDSLGNTIYKNDQTISDYGTFGGTVTLDAAAPLGQYVVQVCPRNKTVQESDGKGYCEGYFSNAFFVEEYRKPEYKLDATFEKESYINGETLKAELNANYFFGAPVSEGKVNWSLIAQNYYFDEYKGEWFNFTNDDRFRCFFDCSYDDEYITSGEGTLDANGKMDIRQAIDLGEATSGKIYTLRATVQDQNNQTVAGSQSVLVHRGAFYVGIKNEKYIVKAGEKMPIKIVTVDPKGNPLNGKKVKVELMKQDWKTVKKKNVDGGFYWDNELEETRVDQTFLTTGEEGKESYEFEIKEGGEYVTRASAEDDSKNVMSAAIGFYVTTNEPVYWRQDNNNRMELKMDKVTYDVGDTAKILIKSPYTNVKALLTLEGGEIMESRIIDIVYNADVIEIPITESGSPNFYVSVLMVKGGDKKDSPDFKLGYTNVIVNTDVKELGIAIKTDKPKYHPRERVEMEITTTDKKGNPVSADVSVAVVDASLLALKGNPKRDLVNLFYNRRALGVYTADSLTHLLERVDITTDEGAKGGGGGGEEDSVKPRGEFEDTAFFRTTLQTGDDGKITTSFALPDNLTTWNMEVIGSTKNHLFGSVNQTIIAQKEVILRPILPRFALFKDTLNLGALVHNFTDKSSIFTVDLTAENLDIVGGATQKITIPPQGVKKVMWETRVPKVKIGTRAVVTMSAKSDRGEDSVVQTFPIESYSTPETVALSAFTDDVSFTENVLLPKTIDPELGELKITTGATVATYIADSLNYLLSYPYGCSEQTISRLIPNVVLKSAIALPNLSDKIKLDPILDEKGKEISFDTLVGQSLQRMYSFQRDDGGWGYFAGADKSYPYLTAYIVFGLEKVQKAGYAVDQKTIDNATRFLQDHMRNNEDLIDPYAKKLREKTRDWANDRAYMLFVMSEIGKGDLGLSNSLYNDKKLLSNDGKIALAMTLHTLYGHANAKVKELVEELENEVRIDTRGAYIRSERDFSYRMMTSTKMTALTIQLLNRVDPENPLLPRLVKWLIATRKDGRWETTQENVAALIALTEFLETNGETTASYKATITLNGEKIHEHEVGPDTILDQQEIVRAIADLKPEDGGNKVVFQKEGNGRLYYDMILRYFLPAEEILPRSEGFEIHRDYYRLDDKKMEYPVVIAKAGETLHGHLTIMVPEDRNLVAVENFLPAGFELVNFKFKTADRRLLIPDPDEEKEDRYYWGYQPWTHEEMRDDRLFLFADHLPIGLYEYDYYVNVTSEGGFHHPPAIISEMYFPENFGRTKGELIQVKE